MRNFVLLILAFGAASEASTAERQLSAKERHETGTVVRDYARCVVRLHHDQAATMLRADSDNNDIMRRYSSVIDENCMTPGVGVSFPADLYRYSMAEALVTADFLKGGPASFGDRLPLAHLAFPQQAELDKALAKAKSARQKKKLSEEFLKDLLSGALSRYGECVVREDPAGARLWILTPPDIPEELSRVKALLPAMSTCLEPGTTVKFPRELLRGSVALNYYRLAHAPLKPSDGAAH